jgi:hypothetical protein
MNCVYVHNSNLYVHSDYTLNNLGSVICSVAQCEM